MVGRAVKEQHMARELNMHQQRGFSLIEALFSALILGIALLALAGFQAVALQDSSLIKARSVAANLAQEKLDDLKSFTYLTDGTTTDDANAVTTSNYCGQGTFCFSEIATGSATAPYGGGQENADGTLKLARGAVTGYIDNYTRTWTVTCSAEAAATALSFSTTCNSSTVAKLVTVRIEWNDSKGALQFVELQGVIYAMDPSRITRAAVNPVSTQKPQQPYTPIGVPDAVPVPISTGDGKYKESSKPLPDVSSKGYSLRTEFDAVSYTTAGGTTKKDSQLQFATVNCVCEFAGSGQGYPASYFYWDGGSLKIKVPGATIAKMTGTAPTISGDKQDDLCTACCRDHHDSEAPGTSSPDTALYDPQRPSADYIDNNHKHYYYVNSSQPAQGLTEVAESTGNRYLEACRFARVDGFWRLLQDWQAIDLVVMPYDNPSAGISYLSNSTTLGKYQTYLQNYLKYQAQVDCTSAGGTGCTSINQGTPPDKTSTSVLPSRNLPGLTQPAQLLARALYADKVYGEDTPRTLDASYYTYLANKIVSGTWLDILPFNEVNVTLLTSWASSNTSVVTVSNEQIIDIEASASNYYGVYSRGSAEVVNSSGSSTVYAYLLPSTSGLTGGVTRCTYPAVKDVNCNVNLAGNVVDYDSSLAESGTIPYASEIGIDRHDHRQGDYVLGSDRNRLRDSITISATSGTSVSGKIRAGNADAEAAFTATSLVSMLADPTASCTVSNLVAGVADYTCTLTDGYAGTVTASTTLASGFFDVGSDTTYDTEWDEKGYSASAAKLPENVCDMTTSGVNASCKNFWLFSNKITIKGTCAGTACGTATIASNDGSGAVACTYDGGTVTCPVTLNSSSKLWEGAITINGTHVSTTGSCTTSDPASATTSTFKAGPEDMQGAFTLCATSGVAVAPSAPNPAWTSTGNPESFVWPAVAGATGYYVYGCTTTNKNSLTACTPSTLLGAQGTTTYSPGAPSSKDTKCYYVKAYNDAGTSSASSTMCIYFKTPSTYTYSP
jgi:type II secretory pathway pseudopilin PulG